MNESKLLPLVLVLGSLAASAGGEKTGTLVVEVKGLRSDKGTLGIEVYSSDDGFPGDPKKARFEVWSPIKAGAATAEFKDLPYGWYAVAVCHDENDNKKCDANFFGMPTEGFATSNAAHRANMIPKFEKAKLVVDEPRVTTAIADLSY